MIFLTHLNLNNNELQNVTVQNLASAPSSPKPGQMYFSTANKTLQVWDGTKWLAGGTADIPTLIIENINGLQGALDSKANAATTTSALALKETITGAESKIATALGSAKEYTDGKVKTDVPAEAIFTDTVYTHPASHPATMITESAAKRFVSDIEKTKWNGKWDYDEEVIKAVKVDAAINADTVGGLTVKTAVPTGAKFTDTVPTLATLKLDKVDNTSDLNKPVSTAQGAALALKADKTQVLTDVPKGALFTDTIATKSSIGLGNVDNTSDAAKPISTATAAALDLKESVANVETKIQAATNSSKTYADQLITDLIDGAPEDLNTLKELAQALANDASYASTLVSKLSLKTEKKVEAIGDGVKTSFLVAHDFETRDVTVTVRETGAPYAVVYTDIEMTTEAEVTVKFAKAPLANQYTVTIIG